MAKFSTLLTRIKETQTEILRLAPYRDVSLVPNPGASQLAIAAVEERIGHRLPPSYREFLALHDGWPRFFEGATLLGTANLGKVAAGLESYRKSEEILAGLIRKSPADLSLRREYLRVSNGLARMYGSSIVTTWAPTR